MRHLVWLGAGLFLLLSASCGDDTTPTSKCAGVSCPAGQTCNPNTGKCEKTGTGDGPIVIGDMRPPGDLPVTPPLPDQKISDLAPVPDTAAGCSDGIKNGGETDVDCGGGTCPKCANGKTCAAATDCTSGQCDTATKTCKAVSCTDGAKNGSETDVDCGGGTCPGCAVGKICATGTDCASKSCSTSKVCAAATCTDTIKNGAETDVDCGGATCPKCATGKTCVANTDCTSGTCSPTSKTCVGSSCTDGVKNGTETDVDCGGASCAACVGGKACLAASDCDGKVCLPTKLCGYAPSCAELRAKYGQTADGEYLIQPPAIAKMKVRCDMTTDGGGWTLVGKGRQGWTWADAGQGAAGDVLAHTTTAVAYLPSATVRAIAGNINWDNWGYGLRVNRGSGVDDKWFYTPKHGTGVSFAWSRFNDNRGGCGTAPVNHLQSHVRQVGGLNIIGQADLIDTSTSLSPNNCSRVFTFPWTGHNCQAGFATGNGCNPTGGLCWVAGTETHCIPQVTVWVKECPTCPQIYYDSISTASYPAAGGNTWNDISGWAGPVNATINSTYVTKQTLGPVSVLRFPGTAYSRAAFANGTLNTQAMTFVAWVYSQNPNTDTNQGGLYVNRNDTVENQGSWVWFGKWATNQWYFRANPSTAPACCNDLPGSGTADFATNIPLSTWRMVHFGFQTGRTVATGANPGWKWGVNGSNAYVGAIAARPYGQSEATSSIGYGHSAHGAYWLGGIGAVRIYNRLLTDAELAALFNQTKAQYGVP